MHINHRRKNLFRGKHHGRHSRFLRAYSLKPFKVADSRRRRAGERDLLRNRKYDLVPTKVFRDILWNYW